MRVHLEKSGIRAMGIAESTRPLGTRKSILCSIVMRSDLIIDGCIFGRATVGGNDSTENIISMFRNLKRKDINLIMILGSIISHYNVIDGDKIAEETGIPLVAITFKNSIGLDSSIRERFPDWQQKLDMYDRIRDRRRVKLATGYHVYLRPSLISFEEARKTVEKFTLQGALPEPLRVARLIARARASDNQ